LDEIFEVMRLLEYGDFFAESGGAGLLVGERGCCNGTNNHTRSQ